MTLDHTVTITLDTTIAFDNITPFIIPLVALLTSPVMERKEILWNSSVLQRVHVLNLVYLVCNAVHWLAGPLCIQIPIYLFV
jgi:hypothetical protein